MKNNEDYKLKYAILKTMSNEDCRAKHKPDAPIHDFETLCALSDKAGVGVCFGDSGGPLVYNNTLIGIASWTTSNCTKNLPDGFTRVSLYTDWISENLFLN